MILKRKKNHNLETLQKFVVWEAPNKSTETSSDLRHEKELPVHSMMGKSTTKQWSARSISTQHLTLSAAWRNSGVQPHRWNDLEIVLINGSAFCSITMADSLWCKQHETRTLHAYNCAGPRGGR